MLAWGGPAGAHAQLVETSPVDDELLTGAPPEQVRLTFDEPMEITGDAIRVLGPDGERVDASTTRLSDGDRVLTADVDDAGRGTYTVAWRATSEDGHTLTGSFVFHVEVRTGAQEVDDGRPLAVALTGGLARWLVFVGMVTAFGAVMLALLGDEAAAGRLRRLVLVAAGVGLGGTVLLLLAETATTSGRSLLDAVGVVGDIGLGSRTGRLIALRGLLLAVAAAGAAVPWVWRRARVALLLPLCGAAVVSAASGHPWTASNRVVAVVADSTHLTAAGVWAGGTLALLAALRVADDLPQLVRRFSQMAVLLVAIVVATGVVSALFQVPSIDALTDTTYGRLLLAKVAVVVAMVAVGAVNRRQIVPRVERLVRHLRRNLAVEVALAAVVLALTAGLVEQPPARVTVDQPVDEVVRTEDATLQLTVDPARVGTNTIHLYFYGADGSSPLSVDAVEVEASIGDVPPRRLDVVPVTPSHVSAEGASLGSPGTWTLEVTAVSSGESRVFTAEVPIR